MKRILCEALLEVKDAIKCVHYDPVSKETTVYWKDGDVTKILQSIKEIDVKL